MEGKVSIPNLLTFSRLVVALLIGVPFLIWETPTAAMITFVLFVLGSVTDYIDGYLARKWNQVSELGRMMDPIADKVIVLMLLAVLTGLIGVKWYIIIPLSVIFFREVLVSGMREFLGDRAVNLKVTQLAKWKTAAQMTSMAIILLAIGLSNTTLLTIGLAGLWIAAALTGITGFDYARKAVALLND